MDDQPHHDDDRICSDAPPESGEVPNGSRPSLSILVALIHNNNEQRNSYIRPRLDDLAAHLRVRYPTATAEISYQPSIVPHSVSMALTRDLMYWQLDRSWLAYREITSTIFSGIGRLSKNVFRKYIARADNALGHWKRSSAIEVIVTDKHVRMWERFLDSRANVLVCMEDDAVYKNNTSTKLGMLLELVEQSYSQVPVYADLGGGCSISDLGVDRLEIAKDEHFRYFRKPVTNTACAYLASRPLIAAFHELLIKKPSTRLISIDWMMNKLFIDMKEKSTECFCVHADPTFFDHGSVTGRYLPWERRS